MTRSAEMPRSPAAARVGTFEALPIALVFVALLALFMVTAPSVFLSPYIYMTFLSTLPPLILLATGLTFVIGAGEIDLCFPSIIAFSGFIFAVLFKDYDLGWFAVLVGLASGVLVGFVNGVIVAKARETGLAAPTHEQLIAAVKRVERGELPAKPENLFGL